MATCGHLWPCEWPEVCVAHVRAEINVSVTPLSVECAVCLWCFHCIIRRIVHQLTVFKNHNTKRGSAFVTLHFVWKYVHIYCILRTRFKWPLDKSNFQKEEVMKVQNFSNSGVLTLFLKSNISIFVSSSRPMLNNVKKKKKKTQTDFWKILLLFLSGIFHWKKKKKGFTPINPSNKALMERCSGLCRFQCRSLCHTCISKTGFIRTTFRFLTKHSTTKQFKVSLNLIREYFVCFPNVHSFEQQIGMWYY